MALARMAANGVDAPVGQGEKKRGSRCFAVFGCTPLGLMAVGALRLLAGDAAVILAVDRSATRRELALRYEATQALAPDRAAEALRRLDSGRGFDGVVEASGTAEGLAASFALLAAGGTLASLSAHPTELVPLPMRACCEKSARLSFGTRRAAARRLFPTALKLLRAKRFPVREVVTHRYSIDEAQEAYEAAADEAGDASAVFLYPSGQAREGAARALYSSLD
uniref:Alcohol dehydrogenase-like C-terminal domain-containing protein n=2 Tax=Emiliania huxleyi TaxID=2903 RepID=A0A6V2NVM4_EMIHU|mmetsp:Transcript_27244/g.81654  ORF Transcript_27244/g.81654 Transcript_27244/m.81654 type:complete len:223 (+) Transcript_27244:461-1129(+)